MDKRNDELNRFKAEINLSEYAASVGYTVDRRESSARSIVMRMGNKKIAIGRRQNNHYIYYSFRDESDNGTIIDFVQRNGVTNLGAVRKELRPWIGGVAVPVRLTVAPSRSYANVIEATEKDREAVMQEFARQDEITGYHTYLNDVRCIPESIMASRRFQGRIYTDRHHNAVFPHYDPAGLCGFEKKNECYTGFSAGGEKTIWVSNAIKGDTTLAIVESGIEALSHAALFNSNTTRYISMSGTWSETAIDMVKQILVDFKGQILLAFNNDFAGRELEDRFRGAIGEGYKISVHYPDREGEDWNDQLRRQL